MIIDRPKQLKTVEDALTINMRSFSVYRILSNSFRTSFMYRGLGSLLLLSVLAPSVIPVFVYADEIPVATVSTSTKESIVQVDVDPVAKVDSKAEETIVPVDDSDEGGVEENVSEESGVEINDSSIEHEEIEEGDVKESVIEEEIQLIEIASSTLSVEDVSATSTPATSTPIIMNEESQVGTTTVSTSTTTLVASTTKNEIEISEDEGVATSSNKLTEEGNTAGASGTSSPMLTVDPADLIPPDITIVGNNPAFVAVGVQYVDQGVLVNDNKSNNLGHTIRVNGIEVDTVTLDTSTTSEYAITYVAVDQDGNTAVAVRTVFVGIAESSIGEGVLMENGVAGGRASSTTDTVDVVFEENHDFVPQQNIEFNLLNKHVFSESDCVVVGNGEFYCVTSEDARTKTTNNTSPVVFAKKSDQGNKEIYFNNGESLVQITNNDFDDDRPVYDAITGIIVWQSLRGDRLQIVSYNTVTGVEVEITNTPYNNSNPHVQGTTVVWQGWVNNNWEIFVADATRKAEDTLEPVTRNVWNDMFPQVKGDIVTWQSRVNDAWKVFIYDIRTKEISEVAVPAGGSIENPRFVILVENRLTNGDVETYGYDITTKETFPLGAERRATQEIPENPAQTEPTVLPVVQEVRAPKDDEGGVDDTL